MITFADSLEQATPFLDPLSAVTMKSKISQYRWSGIQSIAAMASNLLALSPDEAVTHETGISSDIPIFSYHATSHLIIRSLVKAIEVAVALQNSTKCLHGSGIGQGIDIDPKLTWSRCIKSLLTCLISLEASIWGSHNARAALQSLMRKYGDTLSECWTVEPVSKGTEADDVKNGFATDNSFVYEVP